MSKPAESDLGLTANEPLSKHTTWGIGGPADWYAEPTSVIHLSKILEFARSKKLPVFYLGNGSNLLVSDEGIAGLVLRLRGDFEAIDCRVSEVRAGAGVLLPTLVKHCAEKGLGGIEPLVGVPGTVGGALAMNAGTRDLEIGRVTISAEVLKDDGTVETIPADKIQFTYRHSSLYGKAVTHAVLRLTPGKKEEIRQKVGDFLSQRLKTQPIGTQNVGSVFKNPEGDFAARLIEAAGFKGHKMGRVQVSPKHANFIENKGGATAKEARALILELQNAVKLKFNIDLIPEVKMVGRGF